MSYVHVGRLAPGDEGTDRTLREMRRMARAAVPTIPAWLRGLRGWQIREFMEARTSFLDDPPGTELVRTPADLLAEISRDGVARADCDDVAVLGAALGLASGHRARYRVVGFDRAGPFGHVWTELVEPRTGYVEDLDVFRPRELPPGLTIERQALVEV